MGGAILPFYPGLEGHRHAPRTHIAHGGLWKHPRQPQLSPHCCGRCLCRVGYIAHESYSGWWDAQRCKDMQGCCHIYVIESTMGPYPGLLSTFNVLTGCPGLYMGAAGCTHACTHNIYILYNIMTKPGLPVFMSLVDLPDLM